MKRAIPFPEEEEFFPSLRDFCEDDLFYNNLMALTQNYFLSEKDIRAISSWGKLNDQKVLIDYGCPSRKGYRFYKLKFLQQRLLHR